MAQARNITIRCTSSEYDSIVEKARSYGMGISEYIRFVALNSKIIVKGGKP